MDHVNPIFIDLIGPSISGLEELINHINELIEDLPARSRLAQDNDYGVPVKGDTEDIGNANGHDTRRANGLGNGNGDSTNEDDPDPWPARPEDPIRPREMGPPGRHHSQGFNSNLFYLVTTQVTDANRKVLGEALLTQLIKILRLGHHDPQPALDLMQKLMRDLHLKDVLEVATEDEIVQLLSSPHTGLNMLGLNIVHKAGKNARDCMWLARSDHLFIETINTWMMNENTTVGTRATRVLGDILEMDCASKASIRRHPSMLLKSTDVDPGELDRNGRGVVWRRLWDDDVPDQGILGTIRSATRLDLRGPGQEISEEEYKRASIAQGRLMDLLPRLVNLEPLIVLRSGLLNHVITTMIRRSDMIMTMTFDEFLKRLVVVARVSPKRTAEVDAEMGSVVRTACRHDDTKSALLMLPNTMVEEEAVPLRDYLNRLLSV